jgi:hypothetical protein
MTFTHEGVQVQHGEDRVTDHMKIRRSFGQLVVKDLPFGFRSGLFLQDSKGTVLRKKSCL